MAFFVDMAALRAMTRFTSFALAAVLICSSGCATMATVNSAKRDSSSDTATIDPDGKMPRPAFLLLLPLAVPVDIVTCPFQAIFFLMYRDVH